MSFSAVGDQDRWAGVDRDCLLLAIEQSLRVRTAAQFYAWTQGVLQSLLPHDVLCYATFGARGQLLNSDVLCPIPLSGDARECIERAEHGMSAELLGTWERRGHLPLILCRNGARHNEQPAFAALLAGLGFENVAAHGTLAPGGSVDAFFAFARRGMPVDLSFAQSLELIMPHLRAALIRFQSPKRPILAPARRRSLTGREVEVLRLLQHGRSNAQIGAQLSISPLTVKNHVQKVLRKLGARNRTHAATLNANFSRVPDA